MVMVIVGVLKMSGIPTTIAIRFIITNPISVLLNTSKMGPECAYSTSLISGDVFNFGGNGLLSLGESD